MQDKQSVKLEIKEREFTKFVRVEDYNLIRWTAYLSTFLFATTIAIVSFGDGLGSELSHRVIFISMIVALIANVVATWSYMFLSVYGYYNVFAKREPPRRRIHHLEMCAYRLIQKKVTCYRLFIWFSFLVGLGLFIAFFILRIFNC